MPLTNEQFDSYAQRLAISSAALSYITTARSTAPARSVGSTGRHNSIWRFPSHKMGVAVVLESGEEHTYAAQLEYDTDILEYWDQPPRVSLDVIDRRGGRRKAGYTPDFLVLSKGGAYLVQVKTPPDCALLAQKNPHRWSWDGSCASDAFANQYFEAMGLTHRMVSDGQERKVFAENCLLRLRLGRSPASLAAMRRLLRAIAAQKADQVLSLAQLLDNGGAAQVSDAVRLIDQAVLFTDLDRCRLSTPAHCLVSRSEGAVSAHLDRIADIEGSASRPVQLSAAEAKEVHERLRVVRDNAPTHRSARTRRRWRAMLAAHGGHPEGLRPRHYAKGNRYPRFSDDELIVVRTSIQEHYLGPDAISVQAAYAQYLVDHQLALEKGTLAAHCLPVSNKTFTKLCKDTSAEESEQRRSGARAAAAAAPPVDPRLAHLGPARAFERAHTDHYVCDLHVVVIDSTPPVTRRPWITALRDQATGQILATSLSFSSPSKHSVLGVIRDCARRWNRLPETIVVDNGEEFNSTYFETTLASLGVTKQSRPPGEPRSGGHIEGWFKTLKGYLSKQRGNTTNDARGRLAKSSHKGRRRSTWTLATTYALIEEFIFDIYNHSVASEGLSSRSEVTRTLLEAFPESGVPAPYCRALLARTALPLPRPLKLDRARGVRHKGRWYKHPSLFSKGVATRLEAYVEPWDVNVLYVLLDGKRIACMHGAPNTADLTVDFTQALDSIRFLGSTQGRALLAKAADVETAKLTRRMSKPPASPQPGTPAPASGKTRRGLPPRKGNIRPYLPGDLS